MDAITALKLAEIVGDHLVSLASMILIAYIARLSTNYLQCRLQTTGKPIFERQEERTGDATI